MKRAPPGRYLTVSTQGEPFQPFIPALLPPEPPLEWPTALRVRFDAAHLDAISALLMLFEVDELPGVPLDHAREVSRCVAAMAR